MRNAGLPDKHPTERPAIESEAGYAKGKAPAGACFDEGFSTREGAAQAADARREHSRELTNRRNSPTK
jgi:arginase family enzyme